MPYSVVGFCEIDKRSCGILLSAKPNLDASRQKDDLIYGRPTVSKARLFLRE